GRAGRAGRAGRQAGRAGKINAAYARGGPGLTVRTVERMTGVRIDHYVEVDFTGFMKTVDLVGGVPVCTTHPLKDPHSGLDLPAGTTVLDGGRALQYVRARHLDGSSDLGRMHRQQRFLAQLVETAAGSGFLTDPVRLGRLARTLLDSVRADEGLTAGDLLLLGRAMKDLEPGSSEFVSVPLSGKEVKVPGGGSAVRWDEEEARKLFAAVREDRPLADRADRRPPKRREGVPVDV
ncbi:LytR family transcriptional regulator, partial [Streptomyces sp. DJ]